jgi:predicted ATP-dependent endonuclease of OLD family
MELVFDSALVEEEVSGRRVMRIKKHQVLMRLGHPIMRQAMATLCRQLHDPEGHNAVFRWSIAALHRSGFDALMAFHYTLTAINELREPLHDEVVSAVFRIEGDKLKPVVDDFERIVMQSELHPIKSATRRDDWIRTVRGHWVQHRRELEDFLKRQESETRTVLERRASVALKRELDAAKQSYSYRLKELQDRSRDQELSKLAKELLQERAEAMQPTLFEEIQEEVKVRVQELEEQMTVLRQDVQRTRDLLEAERKHRIENLLPRRFQIRELRVLPLALTYVVPATGEVVQS